MVDTYEFQVKGHLDDRWSDWLGGMTVQRQEDGTSVLVGPVVDQAALHGVIARIRDLGLPLLSVRRTRGATVVPTGDEASAERVSDSSALQPRQNRSPCRCQERNSHA